MKLSYDEKPIILFANSFFGGSVDASAFPCAGDFEFTRDRIKLPLAQAVVFHVPNLDEVQRLKKYPGQLWVAWSMESVANYPELADAGFLSKFDLRMTYEQSADVWAPYLPYEQEWAEALAAPLKRKTANAPAVMFQSAPLDLSGRNDYAQTLMDELTIDSYGAFLNNRRLETPDLGRKTKLDLIGSYKFCLGFENSICPDYVTEKFFDGFLSGTVPVYRGAPNVDEFAPGPHSYINAADFSSPHELAEYLSYLDGDEDAYEAYFAWRQSGLSAGFKAKLALRGPEPFCRLAEIVGQRSAPLRRPGWFQRLRAPVIDLS